MRTLMCFLFAITLSGVVNAQKDKYQLFNQRKEFDLDTNRIYEIYVKKDGGGTTITFPSKISRIICSDATLKAQKSGSSYNKKFKLNGKAGGYYFTLRALKAGAETSMTVIYNRNAYRLYLKHSVKEAYAAVNFSNNNRGIYSRSPVKISNAKLINMLNIAKAYDVIMKEAPHELRNSTRVMHNSISTYKKFKVFLKEVIRFNSEDTLVFKIILQNLTDEEISYDRFSFTVQAGNKVFPMSAADASGKMPPKSKSYAFFSITGTPRGWRNNLSPENEFAIGLTAKYMLKNIYSKKEVKKAGSKDNTKKLQNEIKALKAQLKVAVHKHTQKTKDDIYKKYAEMLQEYKLLKGENKMMFKMLSKKNDAEKKPRYKTTDYLKIKKKSYDDISQLGGGVKWEL